MSSMSERNVRNQARHRDSLRRRGLRPLQIWVPDTRAAGFAEEYRRQARIIAADYPAEDLAWLDDTLDDLLRDLDDHEGPYAW